jgi:signal transduction histidine kinase
LTLRFEPPDGALLARVDQDKLQQIVLNLLSNAVKFTEPGGRIELRGYADHDDDGTVVRVEVADTGIGIAPEELDRVFEPFIQVDAKLTRTREGTGLGLAISRDLARGMNGELTVESRLGVGSTFVLTVPRA